MHLADGEGERNAFERDQRSEPLFDALKRKQRRVRRAAAVVDSFRPG
jgi:hypothetical protein